MTRLREFTVTDDPGESYLFPSSVLRRAIAGCGTGDDFLDELIREELARRERLEKSELS